MSEKPIIAILLGDAAGVGPELAAKCAVSNFYNEYCRPVMIGDLRIFKRALDVIGATDTINIQTIENITEADWNKGLPFFDQKDINPANHPFSVMSAASGKACLDMMDLGVQLWQEGQIGGFVFGPFNKVALHDGGCNFESEHHYLANLLGHTEPFGEINVTNGLYTTRTTSHIPLKDVSDHITLESIGRAIRLSYKTLTNAGITDPIIGVAALNPHCGEDGQCGREEIDVITPAVEAAQKQGINAKGPYSSDIVFHKALVNKEFNSVVTMYHDQGQIALKLIGFDGGITVAGGFDIPIVTCGHGTAYDIAGTGVVNTASFENAIKQCSQMASASQK